MSKEALREFAGDMVTGKNKQKSRGNKLQRTLLKNKQLTKGKTISRPTIKGVVKKGLSASAPYRTAEELTQTH